MNYLTIECNGDYIENVVLINETGETKFTHFLDMSYGEMKNSEDLSEFVAAIMEATEFKFESVDEAIVTLVGEDDIFIWSIIMGADGDDIRYCLVDWQKDGKFFRYES